MKLSHQQHILFSSDQFNIPKEIEEIINSYLFIPPISPDLLTAIRNRKILKDNIQSFKYPNLPTITLQQQHLLLHIHQYKHRNQKEINITTWGLNHFYFSTESNFFSKIYNTTLSIPDSEIWLCLNLYQW